MEQSKLRKMFPMIQTNIVYLDSGALVQKPKQVINAIIDFYTRYSISNRTSDSDLGILINKKIEDTRKLVAKLLNCNPEEIMFNSGTTEGLNYSAQLLKQLLKKDDEIIVPKLNHSSHMIPWIEVAKEKKAKIIFSDDILSDINKKTKIIAYTQTYNSFNEKIDIKKLWRKAKECGSIIVNDAAQAISHEKVNSDFSDIIAFSSNKFFGPTGLGVLYVSQTILSKVKVAKFGGGALDYVTKSGNWKPKDSISKHEPGTLNIAGIFGLYEAINFWNSLDKKWVKNYIEKLSDYAYEKLSSLDNVKVVSVKGDPIILFKVDNISSQDVASYLGHKRIYVRAGNFCAQYLKNIYTNSFVRVSLHLYNNVFDIDKLFKALKEGGDFLDFI